MLHNEKTLRVTALTQTNELNRELNTLKRDLETKKHQMAMQKLAEMQAKAATENHQEEGDKQETEDYKMSRVQEIYKYMELRRNPVSFDEIQTIMYKLQIKLRVFRISLDAILKVSSSELTIPDADGNKLRQLHLPDSTRGASQPQTIRPEEDSRECTGVAIHHRRQCSRRESKII